MTRTHPTCLLIVALLAWMAPQATSQSQVVELILDAKGRTITVYPPGHYYTPMASLLWHNLNVRRHLEITDAEFNQFQQCVIEFSTHRPKILANKTSYPLNDFSAFDLQLKKLLGKSRFHRLQQICWQGIFTKRQLYDRAVQEIDLGQRVFGPVQFQELTKFEQRWKNDLQKRFDAVKGKPPQERQQLSQAIYLKWRTEYQKATESKITDNHMARYEVVVGERFDPKSQLYGRKNRVR